MAHSSRRDRAIEALLTCRTIADAVTQSGVSRRTLERWRREHDFAAELRRLSRERLDATIARLRDTSGAALDVLGELLGDDSPAIRLRAATALLDLAVRASVDDLEARVAALERDTAGAK